jgi:ribonuclease HII
VVAAAVILPAGFTHDELNDSKQLTHEQRETIYAELTARGDIIWAMAVVDVAEIDRFNILGATYLAMHRAVSLLSIVPEHVLIDGKPVKGFPHPHTALVKGDSLSFSIAAASVIAKVTRDRLMMEMDALHPGYDFAQHKGYGTPQHLEALKKNGPSPIHRRTFLPVQQAEFGF